MWTEKKTREMGCLYKKKTFLAKEEQIQQSPFLLSCDRNIEKHKKMYILVVFKNKTFVILLILT